MVSRPEPSIQDHEEKIWVLVRVGDGDAVHEAHSTKDGAEAAEEQGSQPWGVEIVETTLHRPSLRPVYGGPTLLEALWDEMDALVHRLMTEPSEDGGDRYRAEELAWVLAIVTNAYNPDMDAIRKEAMRRWATGPLAVWPGMG